MKPDYERAALKAAETLDKYEVSSAPVSALPILKKIPGVLVVSYEDMSNQMGKDRNCVISMFGDHNQDAFTSVNVIEGKTQYIITYNQRLPVNLFQRALARELGHIVLGHDGSLPEEVRMEEAKCFANHFLMPRPMIYSVINTGIRFTVDVVNNLTGCDAYCLGCMRKIPAVHVPAELNRAIRDRFLPYVMNYFNFQRVAMHRDGSAIADLGTYMDGYEE